MTRPHGSARVLLIGEQTSAVEAALQAHGLVVADCISTIPDDLEALFLCRPDVGVICSATNETKALVTQWPALPLVLVGPAASLDTDLLDAAGLTLKIPAHESATVAARLDALLSALRQDRHAMVAADRKTSSLAELVKRVANSDATVMLQGESGTGKEVFARHLHAHSQRAEGPFVAVNCAAIPEAMLEAMLFGHEKGAYTGAHERRAGKFEQAHGGTLLLDEVSEMKLELQAKLLRVLQEKEIERLGGDCTVPLDVRVVATSNRDLAQEVERGAFRRDLFYRLSVFPVGLPPLRDRRGDIVPLALRLAWRHSQGLGPRRFTADALEQLRAHAWPGNVRELDNVVQRALVLSEDMMVGPDLIRLEDIAPQRKSEAERLESLDGWLRRREHQLIASALESHQGNRSATARQLGISPRTLRYKLAQMRDAGVALPA